MSKGRWDWAHAVELESGMQIDVQKASRDQFADERPCWAGPMNLVRWVTTEYER